MQAKLTSIACNRLAETAAHAPDEPIIAFGADNHVAFLEYSEKEENEQTSCTATVTGWLNGHTARVNAVRWYRTHGVTGLVSASVDKTLRFWQKRENKTWHCDGVLAHLHTASISVLSVIVHPTLPHLWVLSAGSDGLVQLTKFEINGDAIVMPTGPTQTFHLGADFALSADMAVLPLSNRTTPFSFMPRKLED